jgi:hypothetical protein
MILPVQVSPRGMSRRSPGLDCNESEIDVTSLVFQLLRPEMAQGRPETDLLLEPRCDPFGTGLDSIWKGRRIASTWKVRLGGSVQVTGNLPGNANHNGSCVFVPLWAFLLHTHSDNIVSLLHIQCHHVLTRKDKCQPTCCQMCPISICVNDQFSMHGQITITLTMQNGIVLESHRWLCHRRRPTY